MTTYGILRVCLPNFTIDNRHRDSPFGIVPVVTPDTVTAEENVTRLVDGVTKPTVEAITDPPPVMNTISLPT